MVLFQPHRGGTWSAGDQAGDTLPGRLVMEAGNVPDPIVSGSQPSPASQNEVLQGNIDSKKVKAATSCKEFLRTIFVPVNKASLTKKARTQPRKISIALTLPSKSRYLSLRLRDPYR